MPSDTPERPRVHVSVDVPDLDAGVAFYRDVFAFIEVARPFPTMAILDAGGPTVCVHEKAAGTAPAPGTADRRHYDRHWTPVHLDLHVVGFDDAITRIRAAGGKIEADLRDHGPKPVAFCSDPFGNGFCLIGERRPRT